MTIIKSRYIQNKETILNLIWRTLQTFGMQGITFLFFIICAYLLTPYEFGIYNYVLTIIFLLLTFADFGVSKAASKYVAEYYTIAQEKLKVTLFNSGLIILIFSIIVLIFTVIFGKYLFSKYYNYLLLLIPLLIFYPLTFLFDGIYSGLKRFKEASIIFLSVGFITIGVAFILINNYGLPGAFI